MNSSFGPFPIDLNEDHNPIHFHHVFSSSSFKTNTHHEDHSYASSSSNNSISYPFFISPSPQDSPYFQPLQHQDHEVENFYGSHGGSLAHPSTENESGNKFSICKKEDRENGSVKWMSSKMRLMRKMMKSADQTVGNTSSENSNSMQKIDDQKGGSSSLELEVDDKFFLNNNNSTIRVCSDCNTTKTPLWRSGPRGPKSLCNACGIRQRKARRALAAAQESGNGVVSNSASVKSSKLKNKDQKSTNNSHLPFKKRCKFTAQGRGKKNKLCFEDLSSILLSKNSAFHQQVFPQDEKEAAVLLMALSYGLVRG